MMLGLKLSRVKDTQLNNIRTNNLKLLTHFKKIFHKGVFLQKNIHTFAKIIASYKLIYLLCNVKL